MFEPEATYDSRVRSAFSFSLPLPRLTLSCLAKRDDYPFPAPPSAVTDTGLSRLQAMIDAASFENSTPLPTSTAAVPSFNPYKIHPFRLQETLDQLDEPAWKDKIPRPVDQQVFIMGNYIIFTRDAQMVEAHFANPFAIAAEDVEAARALIDSIGKQARLHVAVRLFPLSLSSLLFSMLIPPSSSCSCPIRTFPLLVPLTAG